MASKKIIYRILIIRQKIHYLQFYVDITHLRCYTHDVLKKKGCRILKKIISYAFKRSQPVMYGYLFIGITFGIMLREVGFGVFWAFISSLFIYAGSGQFLMCEFIADNASLITCAVFTLLLNSRHIFYGLSFLTRFNVLGKKKWINILRN